VSRLPTMHITHVHDVEQEHKWAAVGPSQSVSLQSKRACMAMSATSSLNLSPLATKSVSQLTSISTPSLQQRELVGAC